MYLLDTTIISEPMQARPEPRVLSWMRGVPLASQHLSVMTVGEIRQGIEMLAPGSRQETFRTWLETELPRMFVGRLLPITTDVANRWGRLLAAVGKSVPISDSLIAATALHHDLRLVTRNERDFKKFPGVVVVNPWKM